METNYYHVTDPLENFDLKVVVRESSRAITVDDLLQNEEVYYEEFNISWQEKVYGPADIVKSLSKNGPASESQVCAMIDGSLILLESFIMLQFKQTTSVYHTWNTYLFNLQNVIDELKDVMVYTYVDKDQFWNDKVISPTAHS